MANLNESFGQDVQVQDAVRIYQEADAVVIRMMLGISAVVIAPLVEEVVFRGYIYTVTKRYTARVFSLWFPRCFLAWCIIIFQGFYLLLFLQFCLLSLTN